MHAARDDLIDACKAQDGNPAENLLTGTVTWTFSATTDLLAAFAACSVPQRK